MVTIDGCFIDLLGETKKNWQKKKKQQQQNRKTIIDKCDLFVIVVIAMYNIWYC